MQQVGQHISAVGIRRTGGLTLPGATAAAVVVTLAVALTGAGLRLAGTESATSATSTLQGVHTPLTAIGASAPPLPESSPTAVIIPALGVETSSLVALRRTPAGVLEVPARAGVLGWFQPEHIPGAAGVTALYGHTRLASRLGVFHELGTLRAGDVVRVHRANGRTAEFTVYDVVRTADPGSAVRIATAPAQGAELRLLTWPISQSPAGRQGTRNPLVVLATLTGTGS